MPPIERAGARALLRWVVAAVELAWSASPRRLLASVLLTVLSGAGPVVVAWATKLLLDELVRGAAASRTVVVVAAGVVAVTGFVLAAASVARTYLDAVLQRKIRTTAQRRLFTRLHGFVGLDAFEDPAALDRIRLAEEAGDSSPRDVVTAGLSLGQNAITAGGFVGTLVVLCPALVPVVVLAAVPTALLHLRLGRLRAETTAGITVYQRRWLSYRLLAVDVRAAKESRVFGLGEYLTTRMLRDLASADEAETAVDRTGARLHLVLAGIGALVSVSGIAAGAYLALQGRLTVGDVTVLLAALVALHTALGGSTQLAAGCYESLLLFRYYVAVVHAPQEPDNGLPVEGLRDRIDVEDVWFRYGDDQPWALRGVTLTLPAGSSVGLVGLNGAGKSTLVKLLCRFYEPQKGRILWDGVDIRELDPVRLRARLSCVFQDFMEYDFTAAENIGIGDLAAMGDPARIRAAARLAEADEMIERLPRGFATMLSRYFPSDDDGGKAASLSGGQWQRIAVARAFLRTEADVLILDEPTSGLDAEAEHALHRRLTELRRGRLSLLVSHRLNTLRDADRIVVLSGGQVAEHGTHDELMAAGGAYASLFRLQAQGYAAVVPTG
jgi:ATP-binding cassette subfamily B protein